MSHSYSYKTTHLINHYFKKKYSIQNAYCRCTILFKNEVCLWRTQCDLYFGFKLTITKTVSSQNQTEFTSSLYDYNQRVIDHVNFH